VAFIGHAGGEKKDARELNPGHLFVCRLMRLAFSSPTRNTTYIINKLIYSI